jgi:hypothetical protein
LRLVGEQLPEIPRMLDNQRITGAAHSGTILNRTETNAFVKNGEEVSSATTRTQS